MSNKRLSKDERRRINTRKKRDKKAAAQTKRFASLKIPIIDTVRDAFQLRDGGFMDMLAIRTKDLENASEEDVNRDMWLLTSLFKRYSEDIKIISINFPTNTKTQQAYFEQKLMHCSHPLLKPILEEKLAELVAFEKTSICREHYLMFWGRSFEDLQKNRSSIASALGRELCMSVSLSKKIQILFSLNNLSASVFYDENAAEYIEVENKNELVEQYGYNPYLLNAIQPMGGFELNHTDYVKTGNGYETCLYVYQYPKIVDRHWLAAVTNNPASITTIDVESIDSFTVKKDLKNGIAEYKGRMGTAKNTLDAMDADEKRIELSEIAYKVQQLGEVIKRITTRIYVAGASYADLMERANYIKKEVCESKDWLVAINLNEMEYEWCAKLQPASIQRKDVLSKRNGKPVPATTLGGGDPFHYTSLNDK